MKFQIVEKSLYQKAFKKLSKNYRNIELDVKEFLKLINTEDELVAKQIKD